MSTRGTFQAAYLQGRSPKDWKFALMVAIHNSGPQTHVQKSHLCTLTVPKEVYERVFAHVGRNRVSKLQVASLESVRLLFVEATTKSVERKCVTMCCLNFSNVCEPVNRLTHMYKLIFGISEQLRQWLIGYLNGRIFSFRVGKGDSVQLRVTSVVVQGSVRDLCYSFSTHRSWRQCSYWSASFLMSRR